MNYILDCFDPGNVTGVARFENGRLVYADAMRFEALIRIPSMRDSVLPYGGTLQTVIEIPQTYQVQHQKGDQQDLIDLALKAGRIIERHASSPYLLVLPREWKGQRPKGVTKNRAFDVLGTFERDLARAGDHNMWDAIAIGLWKLGRT